MQTVRKTIILPCGETLVNSAQSILTATETLAFQQLGVTRPEKARPKSFA